MLIYLHAKNKHPRSNHLGEMDQKQKKELFTLSHRGVAYKTLSGLGVTDPIPGKTKFDSSCQDGCELGNCQHGKDLSSRRP